MTLPVLLACALLALVLYVTRPRVRAATPQPAEPRGVPTAFTTLATPTCMAGAAPPETPSEPRVHLWVATPAYGDKLSGCASDSIADLEVTCLQAGIVLTKHRGSSSVLPKLRSKMAAACLRVTSDPKPTHFMFCDADIGYRADDVLGAIASGHPVVGLPCAKRDLNFRKMLKHAATRALAANDTGWCDTAEGLAAFMRAGLQWCFNALPGDEHDIVNQCIRVARMGTGVLIVRRDVLERVAALSKDQYVEDDRDTEPTAGIFECGRVPREGTWSRYIDEDFAFSERCRKAGFDVWAYLPARTKHHDGAFMFEACMLDEPDADGGEKEAA